MNKRMKLEDARKLLLERVKPVAAETLPLVACSGRVLAGRVTAPINVPPFDRSPYDGYAFRAADSAGASPEAPVTLNVLEEVAAGSVPRFPVTAGTAARVMTGAPIPPGADAVVMYEKTRFTAGTVTLFSPAVPGENVVPAGEAVKEGSVLAEPGSLLDAAALGTFASLGLTSLPVYRRPRVGIVSTGSELAELGSSLAPGKIYNSNRYTFSALLEACSCAPAYLGTAGDRTEDIAALIRAGAENCDAVVLTGGVSVGDFDLTPAAMEACGAEILFRGAAFKPGMACCYALLEGTLLCGLSGNPAAAMTNFYALALPALRRLRGCRDCLPREVTVTLLGDYPKPSPGVRLLRGRLSFDRGEVGMLLDRDQGNAVLTSAMGCDVMAVVPAGSGPLAAGTKLKGFLLR